MIAIQGIRGSYTHEAAGEIIGPGFDMQALPCGTFKETFDAVRTGLASRGVVAFYNSRLDAIQEPHRVLTGHGTMDDFWVDGGVALPIAHCFAGLEGAQMKEIKVVKSQPEALRQCGRFLRRLNGGILTIEGKDTALSAKELAESGREDMAVICSEQAANMYGLSILKSSIQDDDINMTRFVSFVSRNNMPKVTNEHDSSIVTMTIGQHNGALADALVVFKINSINLQTIRSRHVPDTPLEVDIVAELNAGITDPRMPNVVKQLAEVGVGLTVIGSYKASMRLEQEDIVRKIITPRGVVVAEESLKFSDLIRRIT